MIFVAIGLLLLATVVSSVFFFTKRRNLTGTHFHVGGTDIKENQVATNRQAPVVSAANVSGIKKNQVANNVQASVISAANVSDINDEVEFPSHRTSADEHGLTLGSGVSPGNIGLNIGNQKQQKNKRGGYSQQKFDEFE